MERIQLIQEKEMTSKILKQFTIRVFIYSFLYFATIVGLFIFQPVIRSEVWLVSLVVAINILFLMILSRLATTDAFIGINTTSAPRESLNRIANVASIPLFIFTCVFSFIDIIFFHAIFDFSAEYTVYDIAVFAGIVLGNITIWSLIVNIYEKRILKKYLTIEENS